MSPVIFSVLIGPMATPPTEALRADLTRVALCGYRGRPQIVQITAQPTTRTTRLKAAWLVLTGHADALVWT